MSAIKVLFLMFSAMFLTACSSVFEAQYTNEKMMPVAQTVITPKTPVIENPSIEIWSRCLHYVQIQDDKFVGYKPRYFNTEGVEPIDQSAEQMECISSLLKDYPEQVIEVRGFTDVKGSREYNLSLSQKRAAFVSNELLTLGVPNEQLAGIAVGESEPINDNSSEEQRLLNRRVEFILVDQK